MKYALLALALVAPFVFPWPLVAILALAAAIPFPLVPLIIGATVDALYLPLSGFPLATLLGALVALAGLLVRRSLEAGMMRG